MLPAPQYERGTASATAADAGHAAGAPPPAHTRSVHEMCTPSLIGHTQCFVFSGPQLEVVRAGLHFVDADMMRQVLLQGVTYIEQAHLPYTVCQLKCTSGDELGTGSPACSRVPAIV